MTHIKRQLLSGVFYTAVARYSSIIIALIVSAMLARLLTPADFGMIAIAMIFIVFFNIFTDLGIGAAIVQKKDLSDDDISHIYSFSVWLGIGLAVVFFFLSGLIAHWYGQASLQFICQILSVNLLFTTWNGVPEALLRKGKRFRFIALRTLIIQFVLGGISCMAAYNGLGIYALLINPVFGSLFVYILNYRENPVPFQLRIRKKPLMHIFSYSAFQFLFNFINYFSRNLDKLLIGKYMGMNLLGFYEKSYRLMLLPLQNITHVVTPVIHPVFSQYGQSISRLSAYNLRFIKLMAFIGFPLSVLLHFSAPEIILLVFGNQWENAIPVFSILALSVGMQMVTSPCGAFFQAAGSTKGLFISGTINAIVNISGMLTALLIWNTIEAVAWAWVITIMANFIITYYYMSRYVFRDRFREVPQQLVVPVLFSVVLAIPLWLGNDLLPGFRILSLAIKTGYVLITTLVFIQLTKTYDIRAMIRGVLKK